MSKIKFDYINENEISVSISPDTPIEVVNELVDTLQSKGLTERLSKSTVSTRYFSRDIRNADSLADELIKSLKALSKEDEESPTARRRREWAESQGIKYEPNKLVPNVKVATTGQRSVLDVPNKIGIPKMETFKDNGKFKKSNYGPKGTELYNQADNEKRKERNTGDVVGEGPNKQVKAYTTKTGQITAKEQADMLARQDKKKNKKQKVTSLKDMSPEKQEEMRRLYKNEHEDSSAESEILDFAKSFQDGEENKAAQVLAKMMDSKAMLGSKLQATDQELFGHLVVSEDTAKRADSNWNNSISNWLSEATKPINSRFSSEQEEVEYWNRLKIEDRDDGSSGY